MSLIGLDGKPLLTNQQGVEGKDLIECLIEISDPEHLSKAEPMIVPTPQGNIAVPPEKMLPDIANIVCQFMSVTKQKQVTITLTDKSSNLVNKKQISLQIRPKLYVDMSKDFDYVDDLMILVDKWQCEFAENYDEKYKGIAFVTILQDRLSISEAKSQELIDKYIKFVGEETEIETK